MASTKIYVMKLKRNFLPLLFLLFTFCLLIFANNNILAVKNGLLLFTNNVVPTLLPFFIATELLMHTNILYSFGKVLNPIMKPLFNIRRRRFFCFYYGFNFWLPCWC